MKTIRSVLVLAIIGFVLSFVAISSLQSSPVPSLDQSIAATQHVDMQAVAVADSATVIAVAPDIRQVPAREANSVPMLTMLKSDNRAVLKKPRFTSRAHLSYSASNHSGNKWNRPKGQTEFRC